jgi:hypothetical protein
MTHVRTKAALATVAILLASCTGVDDRYAAGPSQSPPQVSQDTEAPVLADNNVTAVPYAPPPPAASAAAGP